LPAVTEEELGRLALDVVGKPRDAFHHRAALAEQLIELAELAHDLVLGRGDDVVALALRLSTRFRGGIDGSEV